MAQDGPRGLQYSLQPSPKEANTIDLVFEQGFSHSRRFELSSFKTPQESSKIASRRPKGVHDGPRAAQEDP
eukprot:1326987-Pyramimonas_sp.AAC.1